MIVRDYPRVIMPELLYPYLVGVLSTIIVLLCALWAFIVNYRRALEYARKEERLPLAVRWEDLSERVHDLEAERDHLRDELQQAKLIIDEAQRERDWLEQNRAEIAQMKQEREQLEQVRLELQQVLEQLGDARQRLESLTLEAQKAEFSRLQLNEQASSLTEQISGKKKELERLETRLDKLLKDAADAESRLGVARGNLAGLAEAITKEQQRLESLQREIADLTKRRDEVKSARDSLEKEANAIKVAAAQLREKKAALETSIEQSSSRLDELRQETKVRDRNLATEEEAMSELWQPVIDVEEFSEGDGEEIAEDEAIANVREYLRTLGLKFSRRTVNSFHTALKVAEDAPLLVLAGISGTGKSLLPRRYAEAMGFHFLNIPVQPRWDGPQDLIGFFNYLENRYKATELVRALLQMSAYNHKLVQKKLGDQLIDDRMLMVLLDEMNLARVEYYFSEFLSRLETRRDIMNVEEVADRSKAEILLDAGRFVREGDLRVFVDTNVLFVGTMNEDESTLTLSDKVIDRANVMRFGRPPILGSQDDNHPEDARRLRAESFLHRDTWDGWIDSARSQDLSERNTLLEWIQELNDVLARIGRPFGYRTRDAILAYVQQHPESREGIQIPFADQIEQRILPKLRGVDVAEDAGHRAIDEVRRIVDRLGDGPLLSAIDQGAKAEGGHLFTWLGVERSEDE